MNWISPFGIILAVLSLIVGFVMEGGHLASLLAPSAALIVFGGTFGATVVAYSLDEIKNIPQLLMMIATKKIPPYDEAIEQVVRLADMARKEGLLYIDNQLDTIEDPFLRKAMQLVVDGTDPEMVRSILETEMYTAHERHEVGASIFEAAGGYSPTFGIIGTVMGLVHVLGSIEDPDSLGPAIAMAFAATLYGVAAANVLYFPVAARLKNLNKKELLLKELQIEGVLSLQAGYNPILIRERLNAFLRNSSKSERTEEEE
ncbi:chemotaxis protein MotA [Desulfohalotomaculum tongense]|uniref:flagellar motor protein n=1 Tax=Desulforadius tongensis TaxID=1216062 RepID=UPI00195E5407|nr:flagellar motor protein [Desulforadius tongensis]MBM7856062.1 chemotaxis protein MotA [Desulforadius tongensis]